MSNFIISRLLIPFVKLLYPKVDSRTQKEVRTSVAEKVLEIKNNPNQQEFREILIELYNWMNCN